MSDVDAAGALARAATLGPYFRWEPAESGAGWHPWPELADEEVVAERVRTARTALAQRGGLSEDVLPERVVASVTFLGYAARAVSPLLAAAAMTGTFPIVAPADLWWRPVPGGPLPLAYTGARAATDTRALAATIMEVAVGALLTPVMTAYRTRFVLSPQVLWGNVASALAGAAGMITDAYPAAGDRAGAVVARMLELPPLAGTGALVRPDPAHPRRFLVRRNCCLYYRIPGGGTCGDCVLTRDTDRRRHWREVLTR